MIQRHEQHASDNSLAFNTGGDDAVVPRQGLRDAAVIGFGLTLALLLVGGVLGFVNARQMHDNSRGIGHSHEVIETLEALLSTLKDAETGQRGYLLTEEAAYLEPYNNALGRVQTDFGHLTELISDNPDQQAHLADLEHKINGKLAELKLTIALMQKGDRPAALARVSTGRGKALMDDLRQEIAAMQEVEHSLLKRRAEESAASYRTTLLSIFFSASIGVILVGAVFYLSQRNVRQRQTAALVLAEQKERLRTTLASIGDAVITTDTEGRITNMNAVAESLTGWRNNEAAGMPLTQVFQIVNESTRRAVENPAIRALKEGMIVGLANHTILIAKDGTERPIDDSAAPIRCKQGEIVGGVLVFRDITERRRAEIDQLKAQEELRKLAAKLSDADRRKDEFLATLAHELRNPLAPIRNGLQIMRMSNDGDAVEQARTMMERQLEQMIRLVDDLLDVSRISRGQLELRQEHLQLAAVLKSAVETSRPLIEEMGHELVVALPPQPIILHADLTRLAQVFLNLLNNAAKYTERGGHISLTAERQGSDVVVSVKDDGIGIASDQLSHVFEMFTQAERALERAQGGLGIGLTLVKRLVEMHGGRIEARSEGPGKGSEFVVRLPVVVEASMGQNGDEKEAPPLKSSLRILVVDDNRDGADSLAMMLKIMGNETRTAYDGEEAFMAAVAFRPDVMLLDIGLPKLNGYEVCRRIREHSGGKEIVIIAQTGWGQDEDRQRTHDAGFDYHMVKPVDPRSLMKRLAELQAAKR
jgi:PAS domain S-box-containing protein